MLPGWPGATIVSAGVFWAVVALWVGVEVWLDRHRRAPATAIDGDRGSRRWLILSVWAAVLGGFGVTVAAPGWAVAPVPDAWFVAGVALMAAGIGVRLAAVATLGHAFTVTLATRADQPVIADGPYRFVRHPAYAGSLLTVLGLLVALAHVVALALLVLPALATAHRIRVEETLLLLGLGEPYRAYMRRTRRIIPFLL